jgi:tRNA (mo5U34)-methyltransferase
MTKQEKQQFVDNSAWYHKINIGDGIVTPGSQNCADTLRRIGLPKDLTGLTVLDVGANDGYFSFGCKRRGAARVVALDIWDRKYDSTRAVENIRFCRECLDLDIDIIQTSLFDYEPDELFDLVLFMGVLYHLESPLAGLKKVAGFSRGQVILETHVIGGSGQPVMRFYPRAELNNDPTNWWGPNEACVLEMMTAAGLKNLKAINRTCDRYTLHGFKEVAV